MSDTLFDLPEQLSPRLRWMRSHGVYTAQPPASCVGEEDENGEEIKAWLAYTGLEPTPEHSAQGDTLDEALAALARKKGWRLWNEEPLAP